MLQQLLHVIVGAIVLYILWYIVNLILSPLVPGAIMTLLGIVFVLVFVAWVLRIFGISF